MREAVEAVLKRLDGRLMKPVALPQREAAAAVGMGETKFRELLKRNIIPSFLVDKKKRLVRVADLEEWAARQVSSVQIRFPRTKKSEGQKVRDALKKQR